MQRLKSETQDLHDAAEKHELQRRLMKGELPKVVYAAHLAQLYLVHNALESGIKAAQSAVPQLASVVKDYQFQVAYLEEDLAHFGIALDSITPLPATTRLLEKIAEASASNPIALLGYHYVLEGSNNGSKYIAKAAAQAYQLQPGVGLRYLDPYADNQRPYWGQFVADMAACEFTEGDSDLLVGAARHMFGAIADISDDLLAPSAA
jgi:heme oxygenase